MLKLQKKYKELKFTDDFMFGKVLVNNPEICRKLLELLLQIKIKRILFPEKQKIIEILADGKGIRLDVYVDDENGTIYNIEMQTTLRRDLPKRSRYYQGMIETEVEKARKQEGWEVEYMTLYLRDMENREEGIEIGMKRGLEQGLEQGLSALISTLQNFITNTEELYLTVIKNEAYKNLSREEFLKYLK